jgi:hypothetical protein
MIRVSVPIDVTAVATTASAAFALATPLRVAEVVRLAVLTALGPRAPQDKRERVLRRTFDGFHSREYVVEIDGRIAEDLEEVVVCAGIAVCRFFSRRSTSRAA